MFLCAKSKDSPCRISTDKQQDILLIVDDDPQIRKMLMQLFQHHFDAAFAAATSMDAERVLQEQKVTHLLSDYDLDDGSPRGTELIFGWRQRYPSIRRALLLSSSKLPLSQLPNAVDQFFEKGSDPVKILEALKS